MNILSDNEIVNVTDFSSQFPAAHYWTFNGIEVDFMYGKITHVEEYTGASVTIKCDNHPEPIIIPANWFILALDRESYRIDMVPILACSTYEHDAYVFCSTHQRVETVKIRILEFNNDSVVYAPNIPKASAIVCPFSDTKGIIVGPVDLHRYLKEKVVGDLV
jgi:hypothetical protein